MYIVLVILTVGSYLFLVSMLFLLVKFLSLEKKQLQETDIAARGEIEMQMISFLFLIGVLSLSLLITLAASSSTFFWLLWIHLGIYLLLGISFAFGNYKAYQHLIYSSLS